MAVNIQSKQTLECRLNNATVKVYPELEDLEVNSSLEDQSFKSSEVYGYNNVLVRGIKGDTLDITPTLEPQNHRGLFDNVNVEGIEADTLDITPTAEPQNHEGLFKNVNVAGEPNLIEENIKAGVTIFDKTGTAQLADEELIASFVGTINRMVDKGASCTKLPSGMTKIGAQAFQNCTNLALVELPSRITIIEHHAFQNCTNLVLVELPSKITIIENYAFYGCNNFKLTELPSGLTKLGMAAFQNCINLALTELPSGVTIIENYIFQTCTNLTQLKCLGKIERINTYAFSGCKKLSNLSMPNITAVPTLSNSNAFQNTPISQGTGYIYVPDNLVASFKTATNWSTYANQIKGVSELV